MDQKLQDAYQNNRIYLDWNASAPLLPCVVEAMENALRMGYGNPSSVHFEGQRSRSIIELTRRNVAKAVNGDAQGVVFYSGATEANNTALRSMVAQLDNPFLVTTEIEHASVLNVAKELSEQKLARVEFLPLDPRGIPSLDALKQHLADGCNLVSMMLANNEIGNINDIKAIRDLIDEVNPKAILHVDGTQALGRIPIDIKALGTDIFTLSFHKTGGPKGFGAAILREGVTFPPLLYGGSQERGRRPGTENTLGAAGVNALCEAIVKHVDEWESHLRGLQARLLEHLAAEPAITRIGDTEHSLPNTLNLRFPGAANEDLLLRLDLDCLSVSAGSACSAGSIEPSHVILALGLPRDEAKESVRISFGPTTTPEMIDQGAQIILKAYREIRSV